jgi:chorismate lyase/3-hydroxybenzoate synthase
LKLHYAIEQDLPAYLNRHHGHILTVVAFGQPAAAPFATTPLQVDIPVLGEQRNSFEIWTSQNIVAPFNDSGIAGAHDEDVLFGSLQVVQEPGEQMEGLAARGYKRIFDCIDRRGYPCLLRVWHYFPQINSPEQGLERYRRFNVGRHAAFVASGRGISEETVPAASALGSASGALVIYFLASRQPGQAVENPRQTSAYHYPAVFGPRSPIFARAILAQIGAQQCFFISGTASIVGYDTLHHGDLAGQTRETLLNIRTLLEQVPQYAAGKLLLKAYLRHAADMAQVRALVEEEFGAQVETVYLHSSICRSDLLVEIEGVYFSGANSFSEAQKAPSAW